MKHYLFIDESGDHGLVSVNFDFPVFLLCGVIMSSEKYESLSSSFNSIKNKLWHNKEVIFHSRDIRKCDREFQILFDLEKKSTFYALLNKTLSEHHYCIIASAIRKDKYIEKFGRLSKDVYELALSFIIERAIFFLDELKNEETELEIVIEKRGKLEDKKLDEHFQRLLARGTNYVKPERLKRYNLKIIFKSKRENINGLQLADLTAYPIARHVIEPQRANPAFEIIENKFYEKNGNRYGLKIFP
jgi:hypothetical protein